MDNETTDQDGSATKPVQALDEVPQDTKALTGVYGNRVRVVQPLSSDLQPASPSVGKTPSPAPESTGTAATSPAATQKATDNAPLSASARQKITSVYPEPTHGVPHDGPPRPRGELSAKDAAEEKTSKRIRYAITAFGAFLIALFGTTSLLWFDMIDSFNVFFGHTYIMTFIKIGVGLAVCALLLSIGLTLRRETARSLFWYVAIALLLFSGYGTYLYVRKIRPGEQAVQSLITSIAHVSGADANAKKFVSAFHFQRFLVPLAAGYIGSILPLVVLSLPRIKDEFQ